MLPVEYSRWGQDPDILRVLGLNAEHPRTRERFLALYPIWGEKHASQVGRATGRTPQLVMAWVHRDNTVGPAARMYQHTSGRPCFYPAAGTEHRSSDSRGPEAGRNPPQERTAPPAPRGTLQRLQGWLQAQDQDGCCRETIRPALKRLGLSWKKARKLVNRADPDQRAAVLEKLYPLLRAATRGQHARVYLDEVHVRQETDDGYGGSIQGERFWVSSSSPPLGAKVSCYGVYFYGRVKLSPYERAHSETTQERREPAPPGGA